MTLPELKESLMVKKQLLPLYIFTGEEIAVMDVYVQKVVKLFQERHPNSKPISADSMVSIFNRVSNNSILKTGPNVYIIYDDKDYTTREKVWQGYLQGKTQGDNVIVLVYNSMDKRGKFYKAHQQRIVPFDKLSDDLLCKYVSKLFPMTPRNTQYLVELCDRSYNRILLECHKLNTLCKACKFESNDKCFDYALDQRFIYIPPKDSIFDLVDAILKRNIGYTYELLDNCKRIGENPLAIISVLYNNVKAVLQVQTAGSGDRISDRTGLTPWQVKLAKEKMGYYTPEELERMLRAVRYCEKSIKTGELETDMVVDYLLVNVF